MSRAGMTIIELIAVLLIVGVMASIIGPTFRMSESRQAENAAFLLVAHLEQVRTRSLGNRQMVRVDFNVGAGTYVAYADHDDDNTIGGVAAEIADFAEFGTKTLPDLLTFGRGSASAMPGDPGTGAVTLTSNQLLLDDQAIPNPWGAFGTIYIAHSRDPSAVAAVSVSSSGAFKARRWDAGASSWR